MTKARYTALAVIVLLAGACSSKKALDGTVDKLRTAAEGNDYAAFKAMAHPKLVEAVPEARFAMLAPTLKALGAYKDRSMRGISVKTGAPTEGKYVLTYEHGDVDLEVEILDDQLVSFNFHGDAFQKALVEQASKDFKVTDFRFVDESGKPVTSNVFKPGKIGFRIDLQGLTRKDGAMHLKALVRLRSGDQVLMEQPLIDQRAEVAADAPPVGDINGSVTVGKPGDYRLELVCADVLGEREVTHTAAFSVE